MDLEKALKEINDIAEGTEVPKLMEKFSLNAEDKTKLARWIATLMGKSYDAGYQAAKENK